MGDLLAGGANNPWWRIWVQPRQTIRWLADTNPKQSFWILTIFLGVVQVLDWALDVSLGNYLAPGEVAGFIVIVGPLIGISAIYLAATVFEVAGRMFGGKATATEVRMVLAWAGLPMCVLMILGFLPLLFLFKADAFSSNESMVRTLVRGHEFAADFLNQGLRYWRMLCGLAGSIFFAITVVAGLSEVQGFRTGRAVGVFVLVGGLLLIGWLSMMLLSNS